MRPAGLPERRSPTASGETRVLHERGDALLGDGRELGARGDADLGPKLKGHQESTADMMRQIRQGSGRMKPIGTDKLPESDEKALLVYLASIGAVGDVKGP